MARVSGKPLIVSWTNPFFVGCARVFQIYVETMEDRLWLPADEWYVIEGKEARN